MMRAPKLTRDRARALRADMSPPERLLWRRLRTAEPRFRRQHPMGAYVLDFYCPQARLAVEVDGIAHRMGDRALRDAARDAWLRGEGVMVYRVEAAQVLLDPDAVAEGILRLAAEGPLSQAGA